VAGGAAGGVGGGEGAVTRRAPQWMFALAAFLMLVSSCGTRTVYVDGDGRTREEWHCPRPPCLGVGSTSPMIPPLAPEPFHRPGWVY